MRQGHLDDLGAESLEAFQRLVGHALDAGLVALALQFGDHADAQAVDPVAQRGERSAGVSVIEVESRGSWPGISVCRSAASSTVRANGPA